LVKKVIIFTQKCYIRYWKKIDSYDIINNQPTPK